MIYCKRIVLLFCILLDIAGDVSAQSPWEEMNVRVGLYGQWKDGMVVDGKIIAIHDKGYTLWSDDFGSTAHIDSAYKNLTFHTLDFADNNFGVISAYGTNGNMIYTPDGGVNWIEEEDCGFSSAGFFGTSIDFITPQTGYFVHNSLPNLYKVTGGCSSFVARPLPQGLGSIQNLYFTNDSTGYLAASFIFNNIYKTTNSGQSWDTLVSLYPNSDYPAYIMHLENETMLIACENMILRYDESINHIDTVLIADSGDYRIEKRRSISFSDNMNGYAAFTYSVYKTTDGGIHWVKTDYAQPPDEDGYINFIANENADYAVVGTTKGKMFRTTTGGTVGIKEQSISSLKVYPNPTSEAITIDLTDCKGNEAVITLIDGKGREVFTTYLHNIPAMYQLNLATYSSGIYIVKVTTSENITNHKVMRL